MRLNRPLRIGKCTFRSSTCDEHRLVLDRHQRDFLGAGVRRDAARQVRALLAQVAAHRLRAARVRRACGISLGASRRQRSKTNSQRSAKRQPANLPVSGGTWPAITDSSAPRFCGDGSASNSFCE